MDNNKAQAGAGREEEVRIIDIDPREEKITIKGKERTLRQFGVKPQCYFEEKYGLRGFYARFNSAPTSITTEVAWELLVEKDDFDGIEDFRENIKDIRDLEIKVHATMGRAFEVVKKEEKKDDGKGDGPGGGL